MKPVFVRFHIALILMNSFWYNFFLIIRCSPFHGCTLVFGDEASNEIYKYFSYSF
ncbi:hypothetical protein PITCH_A2210008 [uncultured Desulfobacterium sp.]|uniref:Uncharacterized protein n=1 Tax=uncultured Desulfobacterium sp. TaxID=201089 RepID=A0A445MXR7_9BACT|nr:hypothetical protein PITCH_A2210008 [uncultured Desulfobacterium sp.]